MSYTVLVLGGYGNFGHRICEALAREPGLRLLVAGRRQEPARALVARLAPGAVAELEALRMDAQAPGLAAAIAGCCADVVIHTCGPFQRQDYRVAKECLAAGAHYLDLADGRGFVAGIATLDGLARGRGRLAVSGASTVPGVSSAVVCALRAEFRALEQIHIGIAPGNRTERGPATVAAILSYTGQPLRRWEDGRWREVRGWSEVHRHDFGPPVGRRWLASCDVPDLDLFPRHYPELRAMRFYAGLELGVLHLAMAAMASLARLRLVRDWARYARPLTRMSERFGRFGSDSGGMVVELCGTGRDGEPLRLRWTLLALDGDGPYVPTLASVILVKRLARGELASVGAMPCFELFTLEDFTREVGGLAIEQRLERFGKR